MRLLPAEVTPKSSDERESRRMQQRGELVRYRRLRHRQELERSSNTSRAGNKMAQEREREGYSSSAFETAAGSDRRFPPTFIAVSVLALVR